MLTRGSFAPWPMSMGTRIWSTWDSGDSSADPSRFHGVPLCGHRREQKLQVRWPDQIHTAHKQIRISRDATQGGVSPTRHTHNGNPFWISDSLADSPFHSVNEIVFHSQS